MYLLYLNLVEQLEDLLTVIDNAELQMEQMMIRIYDALRRGSLYARLVPEARSILRSM